jgi:hypothetical protein
MEVCSSTEMGAPGASHLGTGDRGPKTDRSRPQSVPVNALGCRNAIGENSLERVAAFPTSDSETCCGLANPSYE